MNLKKFISPKFFILRSYFVDFRAMGRKDFTFVDRLNIVFDCLDKYSYTKKFERKAILNLALKWNCSKKIIYNIFNKYRESRKPG